MVSGEGAHARERAFGNCLVHVGAGELRSEAQSDVGWRPHTSDSLVRGASAEGAHGRNYRSRWSGYNDHSVHLPRHI